MIRVHTMSPWPACSHRATELLLWQEGSTIADYAPDVALADPDFVCVRNGELIGSSSWADTEASFNDDLSFLLAPSEAVTISTLIINTIITTVVSIGISYGIQALFGDAEVDSPFENAPDPTYTFQGIRNTASSGIPIPIVYGIHIVGGNVVDVSLEGNNPFLTGQNFGNALDLTIALCEGEIDAVLETSINGNPASTYGSRVTVQHNLGTNDQSALGGGGSSAVFSVQLSLPSGGGTPGVPASWTGGETRTYATSQAVNRARLNITHPSGLIYIDPNDGDFVPAQVVFRHRYRLTSDNGPSPSWSSWFERTVISMVTSAFTTVEEIEFPDLDAYTIEVQKFSVTPDGPQFREEIFFDSVTEVVDSGARYPNVACTRIRIEADKSLSGALPTITQKIRGRKIQKWDGGANDPPVFIDAAPYTNPAWIAVDLFLDSRYGLGRWFTYRNLDLDSFLEWAEWCDELVPDGSGGTEVRCQFDGVLDGESDAWNRLLQVAATARASFVIVGDIVRVKVEKPREPVQMFTMANIRRDSWKQTWVSNRLRPTRTEVRFLNADLDYQIDEEGQDDEEAILAGLPQRVAYVDRFGITRRSQAIREARFAMNLQKLTQAVEFEADIDSVLCEAGDLVRVAHDVPAWGFSGKLLETAASASEIELDRAVTLETGEVYEVCVRHLDDTLELRTVTSAAGAYSAGTALTVDVAFSSTPAAGAVYSFGKLQRSNRVIKVTDLQTSTVLTRRLSGVVYDPRIHDDDIGTLDVPVITELPNPFLVPGCVSSLAAVEVPVSSGGALSLGVQVSWAYPTGQDLGGARVWYRDVTAYVDAGTSPIGQFIPIANVSFPQDQVIIPNGWITGRTYEVTVIAESSAGASRAPGDCTVLTITISGAGQVVPAAPQNVSVTHLGDELLIAWDPVTNVPVGHYEIRRGAEWVGSLAVGETSSTTLVTTQWSPTHASSIVETFFVRAISAAGVYGNTGELSFAAGALPDWGSGTVTHRDQRGLGWVGTLFNVTTGAGGILELVDDSQPGIYRTAAIDMGTPGTYRLGAVWHTRQPSGFGWVSSLTWNGLPARQNGWLGYVDPAQWRNAFAIEWQASADGTNFSDLAPLVTGTIVGATIGGVWTSPLRYFKVQISVTPSDLDWVPIIEQLYITLESR